MVEIGQPAPDFTLRDTNKVEHTLSEKRGTPVLLVFFPFSFTGVCEGELCRIRDDYGQFEAAGVQVLAISCDPSPSQGKWAGEQGWQFPVLSDFWPHGEVAKAYGVFNEKVGCAMRGTFLIDAEGVVKDAFATEELGQARAPERYDEALAKL